MTLESTTQTLDQHGADVVPKEHTQNLLGTLILMVMGQPLGRRIVNILGFAVCALLLGYAYYLQYQEGLIPCPLCILQRLIMAVLGLIFLTAALHNPRRQGNRCYGMSIVFIAALGAGIAAYHIWVQMSESVGLCLPPLDYLLTNFSLSEVISLILQSPGSCSDVQWTLLGLSIPAWTLLAFICLGTVGWVQQRRQAYV